MVSLQKPFESFCNLVLLCVIGLQFTACQDVVRPEEPKTLISEETMVDILVEAYLGNAARSNNNRVLRMGGVQLDSILYAKYAVDSLQFAENTVYYASQIEPYLRILNGVEQELLAVKKSLDSIALIDAEKQKQDKQILLDSAKAKVLGQNIIPSVRQ
jgi:DNA mismatch repair protein MutH